MCDTLVAVGEDGRPTLFAKNSDRPPGEQQVVEWHPAERMDGARRCTWIDVPFAGETIGFLASRPAWAWGVEHGVNEAGVAVGNETIYTTLDPRGTEPGLPGIDLVRWALMRAPTASAGVDVVTSLLERFGQGGSGHQGKDRPYWSSFLVADGRSAFVVETSGREWACEEVPPGGTRAISNRTTIPAFDAAHRHPRQPVDTLVDPRWNASKAVLAARPVTVASLMAHLRSHEGWEGWTVCMHADDVEATTAAMVAELPGEPGSRPVAHMLLGSPCQSEFRRYVVGEDRP